MENTELTHHGILGQKWGVRRYQNQDGSLTAAGKKRKRDNNINTRNHEDYDKAHSNKNVKSMSDAELRSRVNRLQMEKQYNQLSESDIRQGKDYVQSVIKIGTTVASVTSTAITIYNNYEKIKKIIKGGSQE